jgi:AcrR family transcriptional regulator
MSKTSQKYSDIINKARELFWKHGFRRVSIEEICRKANVSKMTYYKYFPNKTELAKTIFNDVVEAGENRFREIIQSNGSPAAKVKEILLMKLESTNDISPEFMQDFYTGSNPELSAFVEERTRQAWDLLKNDYIKAQEKGIFRTDFNPELFIKVQYKLAELMEDESVTSMYSSRQELIMEFANLMIYGIIPHE